ncbi:FtsK/SpoIIIE domain-containing protein [Heyndrickxia acidicola]|uniref:FtsK/SpoIIIE domain-containing protein n=1 Tax=Heyndrickxia acidicola TaxID=209389 RepID=A0ABU6MNB3_9BACI|nr:FtsK/SpoIIIE domain-containing protein [Heyndrickxia acidicola]MED1205863.1 FtsK/SpoIIIE domain-containing protein [Heyndrickxia acidicola]
MIFEALTSAIFGGLALKAHLKKEGIGGNDSQKIQKLFSVSGLNVKDGNQTYTSQLIRKINHDWGTEYKYRIPRGRSFEDYEAKINVLKAGLNTKGYKFNLKQLKDLKFDKNIIENIKDLYVKEMTDNKEIELSWDGMLNIRVYNEPLPTEIPFIKGTGWKVAFGMTREKNKIIYHDFEEFPNFVEGGTARYGKSNLINVIITSLIQQKRNSVKLHLIDLKGGIELCDYANIKQCVNIAYEPEEAYKVLSNAYDEMKKMQTRIRKLGKKKIQDTNIQERHFIIIDEVGELNPEEAVDKKDEKDTAGNIIKMSEKTLKLECKKLMSQIARLGSGLGFRLILATQYPTGDIVPRQCKQNSDAKLCFRVQSGTASKVVLDETGAEDLPPIRGRAIYQMAEKRVIIQVPKIDDKTIQDTIKPHIVKKGVNKIANNKTDGERRKNIAVLERTRLS